MPAGDREELLERILALEARLEETDAVLTAIRHGEADAVVVSGPEGEKVYTLKGADEPYRLLVERMAEGAATVTREGVILYANQQLAEILGVPLEQVVGSRFLEYVCPEDLETFAAVLTVAASGEGRNEVRLRGPEGREVPAYISAGGLEFDGVECVCLVVTDLSERKRSEEIAFEEKLSRAVLEHVAQAILVVDPNGRIVRRSRTALLMLGVPALLMRDFDEAMHVRRADTLTELSFRELQTLIQQQGRVRDEEVTTTAPDGKTVHMLLNAAPLTGPDPRIAGTIVALKDITESKRVADALSASEERLQFALETALTGAWELDLVDHTAVRSLEYDRIFGYRDPLPQLTLEMFFEHVVPGDRQMVKDAFQQAIETQSDWNFECRITRADGQLRWIWAAGRHRKDHSGALRRMAGIVQDITERKQSEERIAELYRQAELEIELRRQVEGELRRSNQDLSQFASVISHDLRSPLNAVTSFTQQLKEEYQDKLGPEANAYLGYLTGAAERMRRLISDLLIYSRVAESGPSADTPISSEEALRLAQLNLEARIHESGAKITHGRLPDVPANAGLLTQVFQNLLENAIKFKAQEAPRIHISAARQEKEWSFCVADNGIGIEPRHAEDVFRIFRRLNPEGQEGTGIGLSICRKIVERHGGRIWIESQFGEGAKVHFTLPADISAARSGATA